MTVLIAGGGGFLGQHLVPMAAAQQTTAYTYFSQNPHELGNGHQLDLRNRDAVLQLVQRLQPSAIIHLGGSNRTPDMYNVIVEGTRNLAEAAGQVNARLVHMSTDVLFDGTAGPYLESAEPTPIHDYGRAKAESEALAAAHDNQVTVRTSLIYNEDNAGSVAWMQQALARGEQITLFANQLRNPIQANDLARACLELASHAHVGVLNVAGPQNVTRAYFGRKFTQRFKLPTDKIRDLPDTSGNYPLDVRLDTTLAQTILQTKLRGVDKVFD